jgi:hypothetical protein
MIFIGVSDRDFGQEGQSIKSVVRIASIARSDCCPRGLVNYSSNMRAGPQPISHSDTKLPKQSRFVSE